MRAERTKLKAAKWKPQNGVCALCGDAVEQKGSELDPADPILGYTTENFSLATPPCHPACHRTDKKQNASSRPVTLS